MHTPRQWVGVILFFFVVGVLVPVLNLKVSEESMFHVPAYLIPLLGKFLCFILVAIAMDLVWGFTAILSLGHAVFFAAG